MRGDFDEDEFDDDADDNFDCAMDGSGGCGLAGSEECEFDCPYRRDLEEPSDGTRID